MIQKNKGTALRQVLMSNSSPETRQNSDNKQSAIKRWIESVQPQLTMEKWAELIFFHQFCEKWNPAGLFI